MSLKRSVAKDINLSVEEMAQAGVNFGHRVSKLHPKMKQYISGIKNTVHVFDLEKTAKEFQKALDFISKLVSEGKTIIFVGTKIQLKLLVKSAAEECEIPYVTERWLGEPFTNLEQTKKGGDYLRSLKEKRRQVSWKNTPKKSGLILTKK